MKIALFAHYHPKGELTENVKLYISLLSQFYDEIYFVSTGLSTKNKVYFNENRLLIWNF
jgi:methylglyoxal synthase